LSFQLVKGNEPAGIHHLFRLRRPGTFSRKGSWLPEAKVVADFGLGMALEKIFLYDIIKFNIFKPSFSHTIYDEDIALMVCVFSYYR